MPFPDNHFSQLPPGTVVPERLFLPRMSDDGLPTGVTNAIGNYATPTDFLITAPPGVAYVLAAIDIFLQGAGNLTANGYGPIGALSNGICLEIRNPLGAPAVPPTFVKSTGEFLSLPGVSTQQDESGPGDNFLNIRWNLVEAGSALVLQPGYSAVVVCHDDFTGLTHHRFTLSGTVLDHP